jgi:DNA-binding transcriptional LysR family regulator
MTGIEDLKQLRAFVQVAESGSISAAARVLGVAQPTLSRQLQGLEAAVGLPLLRRDTHSMSLTEAGKSLLVDARRLLAMADRLGQKLRADRDTLSGHLRIVSVVDVGQWIVSRALAQFRALHPQITAELHLINRPTKFVEEGFDCGFLVGEPTDKSLVVRRLATLPRALVAAPGLLEQHGLPQRPEDLRSLPWLGILQPHFYARERFTMAREGEQTELVMKPALLLDSVTALRMAALAGAGFTMLPQWMAGPDLKDGKLIELIPEWKLPDFDLCLAYAVDRHATGRLRAFMDFVTEEIPKLLG